MKNKRIIALLVACVLLFSMLAVNAHALDTWTGSVSTSFSGGKGTENDPYRITSASQLAFLSLSVTNGKSYLGEYFVITEDFDLSSKVWTPIGSATTPFSGTIDGGFHTITNLYVAQPANSYIGLFGYSTGTIKNLIVAGGSVSGYRYTGGVCGYNAGTLKNCENGVAVTGKYCTGGVTGYNNGAMDGCSNSANVLGSEYTGGVAGYNYSGTVGTVVSPGKITNCYNVGYVSGVTYTGGIAAAMLGEAGKIENCYNAGTVAGSQYSGAIAGYNNAAEIKNSYYLSGSASIGVSNGSTTVESRMEAVMKGDYFVNLLDNEFLWSRNSEINGGYPCFKWQNPEDTYDEDAYALLTYVKPSEQYSGGTGTAADPYKISCAGDLELLARSVAAGNTYEDVSFVVTDNIQINDTVKLYCSTPIGNAQTAFLGDFDGAGHVIKGLYIPYATEYPETGAEDDSKYQYIGLFGNNGGHIGDLGMNGAYVTGYFMSGIICGSNSGTIERCFTDGTIEGNMSVGGIAGANSGTIKNCYNLAKVTGCYDAGGICGNNAAGTVYSCYNTAIITAAISGATGISSVVGVSVKGTVENCYYYKNTASQGVTGITDNTVVKSASQFLSSKMVKYMNDYDEVTGEGNDEWVVTEGVNINYPTFSWVQNKLTYVTAVEADDGSTTIDPAPAPTPDPDPDETDDKDYYNWDSEATEIPDRSAIATPSTHHITVDGEEIAFDVYNIGGNNYFKLRDVAYILNGTKKQFQVEWKAEDNSIHLTTGAEYTPDGYEMVGKGDSAILATPTLSKVYLNDRETSMVAYFISDNNYFKIRDLGRRLGFDVSWDDETRTVKIDTSITYVDDEA